jgi:hypothetical protein
MRTLDWEHIWADGKRSAVRIYLTPDGEFKDAAGIGVDGVETYPLSPGDIADVRESFEQNIDSGYPLES